MILDSLSLSLSILFDKIQKGILIEINFPFHSIWLEFLCIYLNFTILWFYTSKMIWKRREDREKRKKFSRFTGGLVNKSGLFRDFFTSLWKMKLSGTGVTHLLYIVISFYLYFPLFDKNLNIWNFCITTILY